VGRVLRSICLDFPDPAFTTFISHESSPLFVSLAWVGSGCSCRSWGVESVFCVSEVVCEYNNIYLLTMLSTWRRMRHMEAMTMNREILFLRGPVEDIWIVRPCRSSPRIIVHAMLGWSSEPTYGPVQRWFCEQTTPGKGRCQHGTISFDNNASPHFSHDIVDSSAAEER
jgi:hypothetical protein